eukprot:SAG11_NODE_589_length_8326_cov_11.644099_5_plen_100_part_00
MYQNGSNDQMKGEKPVWSSRTTGPVGDYFLKLQSDGNLAIYPGVSLLVPGAFRVLAQHTDLVERCCVRTLTVPHRSYPGWKRANKSGQRARSPNSEFII